MSTPEAVNNITLQLGFSDYDFLLWSYINQFHKLQQLIHGTIQEEIAQS